ncbi:L-threonine 3-dehydrogenase [Fomes fomentarius]|nr:L-threonine 3-dehydrogenase [Fomes fomentarius]
MRAARYYGPGDIRIDEIPEPFPGPDQVKIKVAWCGICGSDVHQYFEIMPIVSPTATEPHRVTKETLPVVMGHEFSGTIVELGPEVDKTRFAVGQRVTIEPLIACMQPSCWAFFPYMLAQGVSGWSGGLAEYAVVTQHRVHVLPENTSLEIGALMEPMAVAWHTVKKAKVKPSDRVLILGAGPIGIFTLKVAKVFGASWVGVAGRSYRRCELARTYGASEVFDVGNSTVDVVQETIRATDGRGADIVFDCAGTQVTLDTALYAVRPGGTIMNVAAWKGNPNIDLNLMLMREITLDNSIGYAGDHPDLLQAVARGELADVGSLISGRIPLEDLVDKGIKALIHAKHDHVKILVHP